MRITKLVTNKLTQIPLLFLTAASTLLLPFTAKSQDGPQLVLEEMIVTSRFRQESLQDVPDSIIAITGEDLEQKNITELLDLTVSLPNVGVAQALHPGSMFINMRGINTFRGMEPGVSVRIDGVQASSAEQLSQELFDIEQIEVLKGPQGALYGRNALVGAINVVTRKPGNEQQNSIRLGYGNGNDIRIDGKVSGAIKEDELFYSLVAGYNDFDGTIDDGFIGDEVDFRENTTFRSRLVWQASDQLEIDARYTYDDLEAGAYYFAPIVEDFIPVRDQADNFNFPILGDVLTVANREFHEFALNVNYQPAFGGEFKYIGAYHDLDESYGVPGTGQGGFTDRAGNLDILPFPILANSQFFARESINNELRYLSDESSSFRYVIGVQHVKQDQDDSLPVFIALNNLDQYGLNAVNGDPLTLGLDQNDPFIAIGGANTNREIDALGVYAQTNWDISDQVELTLAYRYDREERDRTDNNTGGTGSETFSEHQPKVSVAWTPSEGHLAYVTIGKGFRSGGFNKIIDPNDPTDFSLVYESEVLWSYELGYKSSLLDNRLSFNVAAFFEDVDDHQEFAFQPAAAGQIVYNIPGMEVYGLELETQYIATSNWDIGLMLGLLDSEITEFDGIEAGFGRVIDAVGNQAPGVEHWKYTLYSEHTYPIGENTIISRIDFTQSGDLQWFIDGLNQAPSKEMLSASLTYRADSWELSIWGNNLLDEDWWTSYEPSTQTNLVADIAVPAEGRRFGIKASYNF